jgi:PEP-CTERM motif-containing protein
MRLTALGAAVLVLVGGTTARAALIVNGDFSDNTLASVAAAGFAGAEIDSHWSYPTGVTGWSSPSVAGHANAFNLYFFGTPSANPSADTRFTANEPQHPNINFTGDSPDGGAFMVLDGEPGASGPFEQTVNGLVVGKTYDLSFYWAAGELSDRTGYGSEQLTGTFGDDAFATPTYLNTNPPGVPGSFSGWTLEDFKFTAKHSSQLLSFLSIGGPVGNLPPVAFLDGVTLTAGFTTTPTPEPGVWALLLVGFGGLGVALRRRRALAAA